MDKPVSQGVPLKLRLASVQQSKDQSAANAPSPAPQPPPFLGDLPAPGAGYEPQQPITKELKERITANGWEGDFQKAISRVSLQKIDELDQIITLDQYYFFVDAIVKWMPALRVWETEDGILHERTDYLRITQFYYYFNQPELVALQSPIDPVEGATLTPLSRWLRDFAVAWGAFLDTEESSEWLGSYLYGPEYAYQDYAGGESGVDYKTFNEWFSRTFRDIDVQRPVAQPDDDRIIVFPAESTYVGQWVVSTPVLDGPMKADSAITVKHVQWPIPELLKHSDHKGCFEGGILVHSFLNVYDYHRQHAPASGTVLEAKFIPGQVYLEVELDVLDKEERQTESGALANAAIPKRYLNADDATGYQFVQNRGLMVLQTRIGKIAILPMGMAQVSAVAFATPVCDGPQRLIRLSEEERKTLPYEDQVKKVNGLIEDLVVDKPVKKGDMISSFLFGGSDIVMVFERQSNVNILAQTNVHYPIRSQYAYSNIAKLIDG